MRLHENYNTPVPANIFRPSEIIGILRNHLTTGRVNQSVEFVRGSYVYQYFTT